MGALPAESTENRNKAIEGSTKDAAKPQPATKPARRPAAEQHQDEHTSLSIPFPMAGSPETYESTERDG
ncbi:MAG: hypothetical protein AAFR38_12620 [Planctomycetota bacterium]